ncbi:YceD family protein [Methylogaea oryzae]|uniref:Large ribosomal RNA subunit accumulation protein YceD n=1 Tax=Methylogaea oryzae TaxID=1295382 RepID=A0A8D4VLV0_9GAMM|nr:YceD family protein [Methylogaea oryzae]BBL69981.1 hypothetical protein MoryE10_05870 [Methylogaea oryzae]
MTERLPDFIDPLGLVKKQADMRGTAAVAQMPRLVEAVMEPVGEVEIELHFRREGRVPTIEGRVSADLTLQCQCCLGPLAWRVDSPVKLGVVATLEEANLLPETHEPLLIGDDPQVRLLDIVEDELLLALPIIPQHSRCGAHAEPESLEEPGRKNPFGVLAALKKV